MLRLAYSESTHGLLTTEQDKEMKDKRLIELNLFFVSVHYHSERRFRDWSWL